MAGEDLLIVREAEVVVDMNPIEEIAPPVVILNWLDPKSPEFVLSSTQNTKALETLRSNVPGITVHVKEVAVRSPIQSYQLTRQVHKVVNWEGGNTDFRFCSLRPRLRFARGIDWRRGTS
jgi:hypothetical protein